MRYCVNYVSGIKCQLCLGYYTSSAVQFKLFSNLITGLV